MVHGGDSLTMEEAAAFKWYEDSDELSEPATSSCGLDAVGEVEADTKFELHSEGGPVLSENLRNIAKMESALAAFWHLPLVPSASKLGLRLFSFSPTGS